jgi:GntR family carbon starvation induced transcriptional regulator
MATSSDHPMTRSQWAERRMRDAILTGELPAGARVRVEELAGEWGVSVTPLREALRTLAGEGLITLTPQRGARVSECSAEEMCDLYELRLEFEPYALRLSLDRGDAAWRARAGEAWASLQGVWVSTDVNPADLEPAHTDFHEALLSACDSQWMLRLTMQLTRQSLRFRVLSSVGPGGNGERALAEHEELYRSSMARETERAVTICAAHIGRTVSEVLGADALARIEERLETRRSTEALVSAGLVALRSSIR